MNLNELLLWANDPQIIVGLFVGAIVLVQIDYLFPVDWPAHIAYLMFGVGMFLVVHFSLVMSTAVGLGVWIGLEVMHNLVFHRFLTNALSIESSDESSGQALAEPGNDENDRNSTMQEDG